MKPGHRLVDRWWVVGLLGLAGAGCRSPAPVDLAAASVLEGDWSAVLTVDPVPGLRRPDEVRGTVALLVNRAGVTVPDLEGVPLDVGVHDLALGGLSPGLAGRELPEVVATLHADSVVLIIGPGASRPLRLRGILSGDSLTGRWSAVQRAAVSFTGTFVLRRRQPRG